jgi:hypothetical protein
VTPRGGGGTYYPGDRYYGGYYWGSPWTWGGLGFGYYFYNPYYYSPYYGAYGYGYPYYGYGYPYYGQSYYGYGDEYGGGYYGGGGYPGRNTDEPMGGVRLKIKPNTASVYVDGYYAGRVDDFDNIFQKLPLALGSHRIEVTAPGFRPLLFDLTVRDWNTMTYEAWLEPMPR